ncbi:hypothetical protein COR50_20620 [Chitinophaga caeni]|uniref:Uncharacterized protein n=1 Tax=Chitinophaga caeni TaxID=2029983 RepID=A0A291QZL1_9BACT|nr:hypothetical protein [Chitinophaga caeni]ATL49387.1 hypothetical protein COR50_20620 [Chitinophaga caeni]
MKNYIVLSLFILFHSCTQIFKDPEIHIKDNKSYDSLGRLLSGKVQYYYQNGIMSSYFVYKNGIPKGDWRLYDLTGNEIQRGCNFDDPDFESLVSKRYKVDYVILNKWSEGDIRFITAYVGLKNKTTDVSNDSMTDFTNYLNKYKIKNMEFLFLHNNDTIYNRKIW